MRPERDKMGMRQTDEGRATRMKTADSRALAVARAVLEKHKPELVILFGSRSRGDYRSDSDVDLMLITNAAPPERTEEPVLQTPESRSLRPGTQATWDAEQIALSVYGRPVPVQMVWITPQEYIYRRKFRNSLETVATREGTLMPRNSESYSGMESNYEYETDHHDWERCESRLGEAEEQRDYIEGKLLTNDRDPARDNGVGLHAQAGVESGMKALLEAWKGVEGESDRNRYREDYKISQLLGQLRRADPEMSDFRLAVDPAIYQSYRGRQGYMRNNRKEAHLAISIMEGGLEGAFRDINALIERAREVQAMATRQSDC